MALMATHGSARIAYFIRYAESATLLELLLASPFLSRRRGNWWMRLAIDRDHVGGARKADGALLLAALRDPYLAAAEKIDLARRAHKLSSAELSDAEWLTLPPPPAEPSTLMIGARALRQVCR
jgi:hypothetical protein